MKHHNKISAYLFAGVVISLFFACLFGSVQLPPSQVINAFLGMGTPADTIVVWQIRLPRALAALLVGFALGFSGAALQGLLRNPLAEPGVLGVSASAAFGATAVLYTGVASVMAAVVPIAAIVGALVATCILAIAAIRARTAITLILVGVGLSSFAAACMSLLMNFAPHPFSLTDMVNWMLGSVTNRSFADLMLTLPAILFGTLLLYGARHGLSALALGEEAAQSIGLNLLKQRLLVVLGTGLATGGAVALAGAVGFVGIVASHLVRPWVNYNPASTLLPAALLGGVILVLADTLLRVLPTQTELKLGVDAALIGAPFFVWIALKRQDSYG